MLPFAAVLLALAAPPADKGAGHGQKPAPPARTTVTAELACLHCTFGEGDHCAVCLKTDDKTPLLLAGKAAKQFEDDRLSGKVLVAEGTLAVTKDKRLVLTSDSAHLYSAKDKEEAPAKGQARVVGNACCGHCDLKACERCTMAVRNADHAIILDGNLADQHAAEGDEVKTVVVVGKLFLDKRGLLRLEAQSVEPEKK
jgi:hypothetical protein